jgi:hypothetical protein
MKKFAAFLLMLSMAVFSFGCTPKEPATDGGGGPTDETMDGGGTDETTDGGGTDETTDGGNGSDGTDGTESDS